MPEKKMFKIAIASGKGGTGKTTLSTNLAAYIAEENEALLVDMDVEEPNAGLFLSGEVIHHEDKYKMIPHWEQNKCTLCGICQKSCKFMLCCNWAKLFLFFRNYATVVMPVLSFVLPKLYPCNLKKWAN